MKCMTAEGGVITSGIKLWSDPPTTANGKPKYTLHMRPDYWLGVSDAVADSDCVKQEGSDVILWRCSIENGMIVPEIAGEAGQDQVLVLGVLDRRPVLFSAEAPEPAQYRTAVGPNSCCSRLIEARHLNRVMGKTTGHEEFRFLAVMIEGDHMDANVIFVTDDASARTINLWASGPQLSYSGGYLKYQHPLVERRIACAA